MSEFIKRLEAVKDNGSIAVDSMIKFMDAFDDFYCYCKEAHEARAKPKQEIQQSNTEGFSLLESYRRQI